MRRKFPKKYDPDSKEADFGRKSEARCRDLLEKQGHEVYRVDEMYEDKLDWKVYGDLVVDPNPDDDIYVELHIECAGSEKYDDTVSIGLSKFSHFVEGGFYYLNPRKHSLFVRNTPELKKFIARQRVISPQDGEDYFVVSVDKVKAAGFKTSERISDFFPKPEPTDIELDEIDIEIVVDDPALTEF